MAQQTGNELLLTYNVDEHTVDEIVEEFLGNPTAMFPMSSVDAILKSHGIKKLGHRLKIQSALSAKARLVGITRLVDGTDDDHSVTLEDNFSPPPKQKASEEGSLARTPIEDSPVVLEENVSQQKFSPLRRRTALAECTNTTADKKQVVVGKESVLLSLSPLDVQPYATAHATQSRKERSSYPVGCLQGKAIIKTGHNYSSVTLLQSPEAPPVSILSAAFAFVMIGLGILAYLSTLPVQYALSSSRQLAEQVSAHSSVSMIRQRISDVLTAVAA